jgi:mannose-6-phosphate isomerase-like protein (cupin superfamily)
VADLTMGPESSVPTHIHPTEEAMVILEGELDAVLGDEIVPVTAGQTVLAPPGVKHGFVNKSGAPARLMAIFPTARPERTYVD